MSSSNQVTASQIRDEFTGKKILPLFFKYAIPSAICLLFIGMQTIIDGLFISNYVGAHALASINITIPLYTFVTSLTVVLGIGCQTIIGISSGEGDLQKASDAIRTAFLFLIGFSLVITILVFSFNTDIVALLGADEKLYAYSTDYITTLSLFFPMLSMLFLGDYFLKSQGKPYKGLMILGSTVLLNVGFDYLFIAQLGFGVRGAALATGLSFSIGALFSIPNMFKRRHPISVQKGRFRRSLLGNMLYNGSSEGLSELSSGIELLLFNHAMMYYVGAMGVAAFTSINYLLFVGITVFVGMSDGVIPVLSYNYGSSNMKRVLRLLRTNIVVNLLVGILLFLLIYWGGEKIITLFFNRSSDNMNVIDLALTGSKICAWAFLFNGFNIATSSFFTSMGDAKTSIIISAMRGFGFIAIGIWILPFFFGTTGIWMAIPVAELLTFLFALFLLRKKTTLGSLTERVGRMKIAA